MRRAPYEQHFSSTHPAGPPHDNHPLLTVIALADCEYHVWHGFVCFYFTSRPVWYGPARAVNHLALIAICYGILFESKQTHQQRLHECSCINTVLMFFYFLIIYYTCLIKGMCSRTWQHTQFDSFSVFFTKGVSELWLTECFSRQPISFRKNARIINILYTAGIPGISNYSRILE